ncbi:hypothetical protein F511_34566 [Dorcoceras hygrometricum]|uniref:Uncharacterized protein n=1 Tax=Dorcoceras hygrometricum TaxID=472368 RepID=A0A2Z7BJ04_9LAMI|nr:hypothetical protein F511_34566 [Dorcoceras hygrometricum]
MIALDFSGTTHQSANHNVAPNQGSKWVAIERAKIGEYNATKIIKNRGYLIAQTDLSTTPTTTRSLARAIQNTLNAEDSKTTTQQLKGTTSLHSKQILALNTIDLYALATHNAKRRRTAKQIPQLSALHQMSTPHVDQHVKSAYVTHYDQISTREQTPAFSTTKPALSIQRSPATVPLTNVDVWKCETKVLHSQLSRSH